MIICQFKYSDEVIDLLQNEALEGRTTYFMGSALVEKDLERVRLDIASGVFFLCNTDVDAAGAGSEDTATVMRALSVSNFNPSTECFVQVLQANERKILKDSEVDVILCLDEYKVTLQAKNSICPGFSTMIENLFHSFGGLSSDVESELDPWYDEYLHGARMELYYVALDEAFIKYIAFDFSVLCELVYQEWDLIILGVCTEFHDEVSFYPSIKTINKSEDFKDMEEFYKHFNTLIIIADDNLQAEEVSKGIADPGRYKRALRRMKIAELNFPLRKKAYESPEMSSTPKKTFFLQKVMMARQSLSKQTSRLSGLVTSSRIADETSSDLASDVVKVLSENYDSDDSMDESMYIGYASTREAELKAIQAAQMKSGFVDDEKRIGRPSMMYSRNRSARTSNELRQDLASLSAKLRDNGRKSVVRRLSPLDRLKKNSVQNRALQMFSSRAAGSRKRYDSPIKGGDVALNNADVSSDNQQTKIETKDQPPMDNDNSKVESSKAVNHNPETHEALGTFLITEEGEEEEEDGREDVVEGDDNADNNFAEKFRESVAVDSSTQVLRRNVQLEPVDYLNASSHQSLDGKVRHRELGTLRESVVLNSPSKMLQQEGALNDSESIDFKRTNQDCGPVHSKDVPNSASATTKTRHKNFGTLRESVVANSPSQVLLNETEMSEDSNSDSDEELSHSKNNGNGIGNAVSVTKKFTNVKISDMISRNDDSIVTVPGEDTSPLKASLPARAPRRSILRKDVDTRKIVATTSSIHSPSRSFQNTEIAASKNPSPPKTTVRKSVIEFSPSQLLKKGLADGDDEVGDDDSENDEENDEEVAFKVDEKSLVSEKMVSPQLATVRQSVIAFSPSQLLKKDLAGGVEEDDDDDCENEVESEGNDDEFKKEAPPLPDEVVSPPLTAVRQSVIAFSPSQLLKKGVVDEDEEDDSENEEDSEGDDDEIKKEEAPPLPDEVVSPPLTTVRQSVIAFSPSQLLKRGMADGIEEDDDEEEEEEKGGGNSENETSLSREKIVGAPVATAQSSVIEYNPASIVNEQSSYDDGVNDKFENKISPNKPSVPSRAPRRSILRKNISSDNKSSTSINKASVGEGQNTQRGASLSQAVLTRQKLPPLFTTKASVCPEVVKGPPMDIIGQKKKKRLRMKKILARFNKSNRVAVICEPGAISPNINAVMSQINNFAANTRAKPPSSEFNSRDIIVKNAKKKMMKCVEKAHSANGKNFTAKGTKDMSKKKIAQQSMGGFTSVVKKAMLYSHPDSQNGRFGRHSELVSDGRFLSGHIVIFGNVDICQIFIESLRRPTVRGDAYRPILIIGPEKPRAWDNIVIQYNDVFFLPGNLLRSKVFAKAHIEKSFAVILLKTRSENSSDENIDSQTLFSYLKLEQYIPRNVFFSVELSNPSNMSVLNATLMRRVRTQGTEETRICLRSHLENIADLSGPVTPVKSSPSASGNNSPALNSPVVMSPRVALPANENNRLSVNRIASVVSLSNLSSGSSSSSDSDDEENNDALALRKRNIANFRAQMQLRNQGSINGSGGFSSHRKASIRHSTIRLPDNIPKAARGSLGRVHNRGTVIHSRATFSNFRAPESGSGSDEEDDVNDVIEDRNSEVKEVAPVRSDDFWSATDTHHMLPVFASARAYVPSSFDSLLVQSFFGSLTPVMCEIFVCGQSGQSIMQIEVPDKLHGRTFYDMFRIFSYHKVSCANYILFLPDQHSEIFA